MANQTKVEARERICGISLVAEKLGVRREWVWAVRVGRGTSARVADELARHGIKCKRPRRSAH